MAVDDPPMRIALVGTLDSKGAECAFLADVLRAKGCEPVLVDVGVYPPTGAVVPAVSRQEVAECGGATSEVLAAGGDRGEAVRVMGTGAAAVLHRLHRQGRLDGALAVGGSGGTSIAATAMRGLPLGLPKVIVSTVASGEVGRYVDVSDLVLMPSVVDISGINRISRPILRNAAAAVAAMARDHREQGTEATGAGCIATTMFGVTTPAVATAREALEACGHEVLTFHANGTGGRAFEHTIASGLVDGVLDLTTTELADTVAGGELPAGPDRIQTAGKLGLPQVVSAGAVDVVNFGPPDSVPPAYRGRVLVRHNPQVTLMRTNQQESARIARELADKLNQAHGPRSFFLPLRGFSALSVPGGPFHDPEADAAFRTEFVARLGPGTDLIELDLHINDPEFGRAMAQRLMAHLDSTATNGR
jgi:uncharacterized protein (UPF0261 family)